jgi:hypothetical protein
MPYRAFGSLSRLRLHCTLSRSACWHSTRDTGPDMMSDIFWIFSQVGQVLHRSAHTHKLTCRRFVIQQPASTTITAATQLTGYNEPAPDSCNASSAASSTARAQLCRLPRASAVMTTLNHQQQLPIRSARTCVTPTSEQQGQWSCSTVAKYRPCSRL